MPHPLRWIRNKIRDARSKREEKREKYSEGSLENQPGKRWYHHLLCFTMYVSDDESLRVDETKVPQRSISERYNISELFSAGDKIVGEIKAEDEEIMIISVKKAEAPVIHEALNINEVMINF